MRPLRLILKHPPSLPLDASLLRPDVLSGLSPHAMLRLPLAAPRRSVCLGDLFAVEGDDANDLVIQGDCRMLDRIGAQMAAGRLRVVGDAGRWVGQAMGGGQVTIDGSAGDDAGQAMRGGVLRITGDAGERIAGPDGGERSGMSGGSIVVQGNVGSQAGHRMRRGTLLLAGSAGSGCASGMVAGTIAVAGTVEPTAMAVGMRRGTLLLARPVVLPAATFTAAQPADLLGFLRLLIASIAEELPMFAAIPAAQWRRSVGDRASGGLGEIIAPAEDGG